MVLLKNNVDWISDGGTYDRKRKMLAGELYDCGDAELLTQWHKAKDLVRDYNQMNSADADEKNEF